MSSGSGLTPEIESFNLSDLNVSALDARLELSMVLPQWIVCTGNCNINVSCEVNGGCVCNKYN